MFTPVDREVRRALVCDTAFHDTESLLERVAPAVLPWDELNRIGALVQESVRTSETIERYVLDVWEASEKPQRFGIRLDDVDMDRLLLAGASARGMSALLRAARVVAWLDERQHVTPEDVRLVLPPVLGHRVFFTPVYELRRAEISAALVEAIMDRVAVPR